MWLRTHAEREVYAEKTQPAGYNRRSPQSGVSVCWPVCAQVSASLGLELLGEDPTGGGVAPSAGQTAGRVAPSPRTPSDGVPRPSLKVCSSSTHHSLRPASLGVRPRKEPSCWAGWRGQAPSYDCNSPEPCGRVRSDILVHRLGLKEPTLPVTPPPVHSSRQPTLFSALTPDPPPSLHPITVSTFLPGETGRPWARGVSGVSGDGIPSLLYPLPDSGAGWGGLVQRTQT